MFVYFESDLTSVGYDFSRFLIDTPSNCLHLVFFPGFIEDIVQEQLIEVVSYHADSEKDSIRFELTAGHSLH